VKERALQTELTALWGTASTRCPGHGSGNSQNEAVAKTVQAGAARCRCRLAGPRGQGKR